MLLFYTGYKPPNYRICLCKIYLRVLRSKNRYQKKNFYKQYLNNENIRLRFDISVIIKLHKKQLFVFHTKSTIAVNFENSCLIYLFYNPFHYFQRL